MTWKNRGVKPLLQFSVMPQGLFRESLLGSVFVGLGPETRSAEGEKDEIVVAEIGDPLTAERRNEHTIARADLLGWQVADLHAATAFEDDVTFGGGFQSVPARGDACGDASPGDGEIGIIGAVRKFVNEAKLGRKKLGCQVRTKDGCFHDVECSSLDR